METSRMCLLPNRGVIEVSGPDRVAFLQGLVSNDVALATEAQQVWAAVLTPQGKWLLDGFIRADGERLLFEVEREQAGLAVRTLSRFRLRAKVTLVELGDGLAVHAAWGGVPALPAGALCAADPRLPEAGWRVLSPVPLPVDAEAADWQRHRLGLGLPEAGDLEAEKTVLLEAGFDELHGVSWSKGCYMGQELTARTKYRGLVKRRLVPVSVEGALPAPGTPVLRGGVEVGSMRSGVAGLEQGFGLGLAQLRLEAIGEMALQCGGSVLHPRPPGWMALPQSAG